MGAPCKTDKKKSNRKAKVGQPTYARVSVDPAFFLTRSSASLYSAIFYRPRRFYISRNLLHFVRISHISIVWKRA